MSHLTEKQLLLFYANMPEALRADVNKATQNRSYQWKQNGKKEYENREERLHAALISVLQEYFDLYKLGKSKKKSKELDSLEEQTKLRIMMLSGTKNKKVTKSDKLVTKYGPLVYDLKEKKKLSYEKIALYLLRFHRFKIDQSYICKRYPEIANSITANKETALKNEYF